MNKAPAFQLYARDFLTSEKVQLMPLAAVGAYILLLCQAWLSEPPGTLPDDDAALSVFSRLGDRWPEFMAQLRACFHSSNGRLVSDRLRNHFLELEQHRQKQSEGGKKGALGTWGKQKSRKATSMAQPMGKPIASDGSASATASAKETSSKSPIPLLIASFRNQLEKALSEPPAAFNSGALAKFFKNVLKSHSSEEIERRISDWFRCNDKFIVVNGYSSTLFIQKFNLLKAGPISNFATDAKPTIRDQNGLIV